MIKRMSRENKTIWGKDLDNSEICFLKIIKVINNRKFPKIKINRKRERRLWKDKVLLNERKPKATPDKNRRKVIWCHEIATPVLESLLMSLSFNSLIINFSPQIAWAIDRKNSKMLAKRKKIFIIGLLAVWNSWYGDLNIPL